MAPGNEEGSLKFRLALLVVVLLSLLISFAAWGRLSMLPPDSFAYISGGVSLYNGQGYHDAKGNPELRFPPGYSFVISLVLRVVPDPITAARLVCILASAIAAMPLMLLASRFFGNRASLLFGLAYALMWQRLILSNIAISESLYLCMVMWAVWMWVCERERFIWVRSLAIGLLLGGAYLVRPEGLFIAALFFAVAILLRRYWPVPLFRSTAISAMVLLLCATPYVLYLHCHTGKWALSTKLAINYKQGIGLSRGMSWTGMQMNPDSLSDLQESPLDFVKKYFYFVRQEAVDTVKIGGFILGFFMLYGLVWAVRQRDRRFLEYAPVLIPFFIPLLIWPVVRSEIRLIFVSVLVFLVVGAWKVCETFFGKDSTRRSRMLGMALGVLVLLEMTAISVRGALRQPAQQNVPEIVSWLQPLIASGSKVMAPVGSVGHEIVYRLKGEYFSMPNTGLQQMLAAARAENVQYLLVPKMNAGNMSSEMKAYIDGKIESSALHSIGKWQLGQNWVLAYEILNDHTAHERRH